MAKPKLYVICSDRTTISKNNGDVINEIRNMATLSAAFEVFYNNEKFSIDKNEIGISGHLGPVGSYDFFYIRNNPKIFESIRGKRIAMAYPYNKDIFSKAAALFVTTPNWQSHLQYRGENSTEKIKFLYDGCRPMPNYPIINIGQRTDTAISEALTSSKSLFQFRAKTTGSRVFGYYGNLSSDLYPYMAFAAIDRLIKEYPAIATVVLAGNFRAGGNLTSRNIIHIGNVKYDDMPNLLDVSVATLTTESLLCNTLGSQKVLDSISRGVPVLCRKLDTFVSQLGDCYPCFYETEREAYELAKDLLFDQHFAAEVGGICKDLAVSHQLENAQERFLAQPELAQLLG